MQGEREIGREGGRRGRGGEREQREGGEGGRGIEGGGGAGERADEREGGWEGGRDGGSVYGTEREGEGRKEGGEKGRTKPELRPPSPSTTACVGAHVFAVRTTASTVVLACTDALRRSEPKRDLSPKKSPRLSRLTTSILSSSITTDTVPSRIMYMAEAMEALWQIHSPCGKVVVRVLVREWMSRWVGGWVSG